MDSLNLKLEKIRVRETTTILGKLSKRFEEKLKKERRRN